MEPSNGNILGSMVVWYELFKVRREDGKVNKNFQDFGDHYLELRIANPMNV